MFSGLLNPDLDPLVRGMDPDPDPALDPDPYPHPNPDLDPVVRGMDPRIRIHPKMSWIRNTA